MELNGYELSRNWFDWCFENPEKINPNHTAMYFFIIEHCNRLGWKEKFGLPSQMTMDAIGISNYKTFAKTFADLIEWGFVKLIQKSQNQYSANIVALVKNTKAHTKALTKASLKHVQKQVQSIVDINKPINQLTNKPINMEQEPPPHTVLFTIEKCKEIALADPRWVKANNAVWQELDKFNEYLERQGTYQINPLDYKKYFSKLKGKYPDLVKMKLTIEDYRRMAREQDELERKLKTA